MLVDLEHSPCHILMFNNAYPEFPPFVALREVKITGNKLEAPPKWLAKLLASITSAPELSSIQFVFGASSDVTPEGIEGCAKDGGWMVIDSWLATLAKSHGGFLILTVVLKIPVCGEQPTLRSFLSECRGAGVEVVVQLRD